MVKHDHLRRGRFRASRRLSFAAIGLLVVIVTTASLAVWDRRVERGGGYVHEFARVVSFQPLTDFPLMAMVSAAEDAVLANWWRRSVFIAFGTLCGAIGF